MRLALPRLGFGFASACLNFHLAQAGSPRDSRLYLPRLELLLYIAHVMYDDFYVTERWSGKQVHCIYQALIVAISTRHADAVDIKFLVDGQPAWVALPHPAWVE
ncbi:MAG: hypothetical protein WB347_24175, partial [Terriglobales bacterium]